MINKLVNKQSTDVQTSLSTILGMILSLRLTNIVLPTFTTVCTLHTQRTHKQGAENDFKIIFYDRPQTL